MCHNFFLLFSAEDFFRCFLRWFLMGRGVARGCPGTEKFENPSNTKKKILEGGGGGIEVPGHLYTPPPLNKSLGRGIRNFSWRGSNFFCMKRKFLWGVLGFFSHKIPENWINFPPLTEPLHLGVFFFMVDVNYLTHNFLIVLLLWLTLVFEVISTF